MTQRLRHRVELILGAQLRLCLFQMATNGLLANSSSWAIRLVRCPFDASRSTDNSLGVRDICLTILLGSGPTICSNRIAAKFAAMKSRARSCGDSVFESTLRDQ